MGTVEILVLGAAISQVVAGLFAVAAVLVKVW